MLTASNQLLHGPALTGESSFALNVQVCTGQFTMSSPAPLLGLHACIFFILHVAVDIFNIQVTAVFNIDFEKKKKGFFYFPILLVFPMRVCVCLLCSIDPTHCIINRNTTL